MAHPVEVWDKIWVDFEVRGVPIRALSRKYNIPESTIRKRVRIEDRKCAGSAHLVESKASSLKALYQAESEKCALPVAHQVAIELDVDQRLRIEGLTRDLIEKALTKSLVSLDTIEIKTTQDFLNTTKSISELKGVQSGGAGGGTTVNVLNNAQAAANAQATANDVDIDLKELTPEARMEIDAQIERQRKGA